MKRLWSPDFISKVNYPHATHSKQSAELHISQLSKGHRLNHTCGDETPFAADVVVCGLQSDWTLHQSTPLHPDHIRTGTSVSSETIRKAPTRHQVLPCSEQLNKFDRRTDRQTDEQKDSANMWSKTLSYASAALITVVLHCVHWKNFWQCSHENADSTNLKIISILFIYSLLTAM